MSLRFLDAFAGAGGMSLGFERAGFELALAFDIDQRSVETMRLNNPTAGDRIVHADVNDLINSEKLSQLGVREGEVEVSSAVPGVHVGAVRSVPSVG